MLEKGYFNLLAAFSVKFWLKSGKICKNDDHTCLFFGLILAESCGLMFKELSWDPAKKNEKSLCDPYI